MLFRSDSLAIAGTSGTLQKRFQNTSVSGNLQGKTGTLSGVYTLAGYLQIVNFEPVVFSIMVNQTDVPAAKVRNAIDEIVLILSKLTSDKETRGNPTKIRSADFSSLSKIK